MPFLITSDLIDVWS